MRKVILALVTLGLSSGVAVADRHNGGWSGGSHGGGRVIVHNNNSSHFGGSHYTGARNWNSGTRNWSGGVRVVPHGRTYSRGYIARRPIYVQRPVIRHRYFNYYQRPSIIVENYNAMDGYTWVPGQWQWSGVEWIWQPGHYEPIADSSYYDSGYNDYNDGYYTE
jgi:hypothetical protein